MAGSEARHLPVDRARFLHVTETEEVVDRALVDIESMLGEHLESPDLGGKRDAVVLLGDVERLDAERVARQGQDASCMIPNGNGVHTLESEPGVVLPVHEACEERFGVAPRSEPKPGIGELVAEVERL